MPEYSAAASTIPGLAVPPSTAITLFRRSPRAWKRLWSEDLIPYREMRREFPLVMVAHVSYPNDHRRQHPSVAIEKVDHRASCARKSDFVVWLSPTISTWGACSIRYPSKRQRLKPSAPARTVFLVCQKEEHVWRAYEAVFKRAESDRLFAKLVSAKSKRVADFKAKSAELRARMSRPAVAGQGRCFTSPRCGSSPKNCARTRSIARRIARCDWTAAWSLREFPR